MNDFLLILSAFGGFAAGIAFTRRLFTFIRRAYFDSRVTVRYFGADGQVLSKRIVVESDEDISKAIDELKAFHEAGMQSG